MTSGIRWLSMGPGSGYGDASASYLSGLRAAGVPVSWTPMVWDDNRWSGPVGPRRDVSRPCGPHGDIAELPIAHDTVVVASTPIWNEHLAREASGRRLVAFTAWETDRAPDAWIRQLDRYDQVLVPSHFSRAALTAAGLSTPVAVVPHIAERIPFPAPSSPAPAPASENAFVFYLIATWTTRKAILDAVTAYVMAFGASDDVQLVIHTTAEDHVALARLRQGATPEGRLDGHSSFSLAKALAGHANVPPIELSTQSLNRTGIGELHARGDCFISLSRGEGWGLGAFDAGAFGNPVIVTGWGGSLEYLPPDYPFCIDYDLVPTESDAPDDWWTPQPGEHWARARISHAAFLMRHVVEHAAEAAEWGRTLQSHICGNFESRQVTRSLRRALAMT
jgi:glycosyltransferase involved in cell wall biosynthesis